MSLENFTTNTESAPIDLNEARDLMMNPVLEELDQNDPQFDQKFIKMTNRRKKEEEVRTALFNKVLDGTASDAERDLVVEVVKDRPYYVEGHSNYMENPILAKAVEEAKEGTVA